MRTRGVRETWLAHVLFGAHIGDACRRVLICYASAQDGRGPWMNRAGRIRPIEHATVGAALGMSPKTIANHIHEATSKGLLSKDPTTGYRGRPSAYQATFPATETRAVAGPVSLRELVAGTVKVPGNGEAAPPEIGEPFPAQEDRKVPGIGETQRARGTSNNREQEPAPTDSRAERDHEGRCTAGSYSEWLPSRVSAGSSDSTGRVA